MKNIGNTFLIVCAVACFLGFLIASFPWDQRCWAEAIDWIDKNPVVTVEEQTGNFIEVFGRPPNTNIIQPDIFFALLPKDAEVLVEVGQQFLMYYPVSENGAIGTCVYRKPTHEVAPAHVVLSRVGCKVGPDKIETTYRTRITRSWILLVACFMSLFVCILLHRFSRKS